MNKFNPVQKLNLDDKIVYVVGDLHGRLDLLIQLLETVNFDFSKNILISCGDIIDRGPHSYELLKLLKKDWFYCVRGNHESLFLDFFSDYFQSGTILKTSVENDHSFLFNGGEWIWEHFVSPNKMSSEFDELAGLIAQLPYVICVENGEDRFNVIHAEATRPTEDTSGNMLWQDGDFDHWYTTHQIPPKAINNLLWGRTMMRNYGMLKDKPIFEGLSRTYCGHTPYHIGEIRKIFSHVFLDAGGFLSSQKNMHYGLTMVNTLTGKSYVASG